MYVFAGLAPVWKPMGMVYEYDPAAINGRRRSHGAAFHHVAFTEYHGKIYAFWCSCSTIRSPGMGSDNMLGNMIPPTTTGKRLLTTHQNEDRLWQLSWATKST